MSEIIMRAFLAISLFGGFVTIYIERHNIDSWLERFFVWVWGVAFTAVFQLVVAGCIIVVSFIIKGS
jgi:hypothetical protein